MRIVAFTFGFGTAPALFAVTYLVAAEMTTVGQRGAVLQVTNALLSTGGLFAPAVTGFLVGSAATTTLGFTHAFVLTALLLVVVGALSTVLIKPAAGPRQAGPRRLRARVQPWFVDQGQWAP
ncbi:hypothetical protein [Streptomyces sp. NPDC002545]